MDGGSVGIQEAVAEEGYVKAKLAKTVNAYPVGTLIQVKALDYTSKANSDLIDIVLPNKQMASAKKEDIKLFEAGVYNSEMDIKNNPKTGENKPDKQTEVMDSIIAEIDTQINGLSDLGSSIKEKTTLSTETIELCITELTMYKKSLSAEREHSAQSMVGA